jgi:hypothetical protein
MDVSTPDTGAQQTDSPPVTGPTFADYAKRADALDVGKPTEATTPADSPSAPSGDQSASTDATPDAASEPAKPAEPPKKNLQTRTEQVNQEIADLQERLRLRKALREELAALDAKAHDKPASEPAPQSEWERFAKNPKAPHPSQFEQYEDYVAAMGVFIARETLAEHTQQQERTSKQQQARSEIDKLVEQARTDLEEYAKTDPDFQSKVNPQLLAITPAFMVPKGEPLGPHNALAEEMFRSSVKAQLLMHFSTPEGQKDWADLCQMPPTQMLRHFGRIEGRFEKRDEPAAPVAPPKTVTSAPNPPTTLGRKPAEPTDPVTRAWKSGDFRAYKREADAREVAALR